MYNKQARWVLSVYPAKSGERRDLREWRRLEEELEITKVTVREIDMNMVKGLASIVIDDCFVVHELRIVDGDRGFFVAMPSRKLPNGDFKDIAHPLNSGTRELIQETVLKAFFRMKEEKRQEGVFNPSSL